jgi:hypothetical protein
MPMTKHTKNIHKNITVFNQKRLEQKCFYH